MSLTDILKLSTPKYTDIIPSTGKKVWYRPFLVKEEKVLLIAQETASEKEILKAIQEVIESCFDDIEDASKLPIFDLEYLFIKLRSKSVEEFASPILVCPETKEEVTLKINLDELEVIKNKDHTQQLKLSENLVIGMKYPTLGMFLNTDLESMELSDFYELAINCIDYIETKEEKIEMDQVDRAEIKEFVDNLTKKQFDMIINFFSSMPKIEKTVSYKTSDGTKRTVILRGIKDFFGFASVIQT
jgi:hypothetical protein